MHQYFSKFLIIIGFMILYSCSSNEEVFFPSNLTIENREFIGDELLLHVLDNKNQYPYLDTTQYHVVYNYVQRFYDQVTVFYKNEDSQLSQAWTKDREWRVLILDTDEIHAFCTTGGHLLITSGLLKALRSENELYYLMSFESTLLNSEELYKALSQNISSDKLMRLSDQNYSLSTIQELYNKLFSLSLEKETANKIRAKAVHNICETSVFKTDGYSSIMNKIEMNTTWGIQKAHNQLGECTDCNRCGTHHGGVERYQENVLNHLPR